MICCTAGYLMRFAIFKYFNEKIFTQKDVQPTEAVKKTLNLTDKSIMEMYSFLKYLPCLQLLTMSPFLLIAVIQPECSLTLTDHRRKIPNKKQDGRCREQPSCPFEAHFDDNLRDTVAHMRMLHGDVSSQKYGPGVNFFATESSRFWVTAKSPPFG